MVGFCVLSEVYYHLFDDELLAYSNLTGETILLSKFASDIFKSLLSEKLDFPGLLGIVNQEHYVDVDIKLTLRATLNELVRRGFIASVK